MWKCHAKDNFSLLSFSELRLQISITVGRNLNSRRFLFSFFLLCLRFVAWVRLYWWQKIEYSRTAETLSTIIENRILTWCDAPQRLSEFYDELTAIGFRFVDCALGQWFCVLKSELTFYEVSLIQRRIAYPYRLFRVENVRVHERMIGASRNINHRILNIFSAYKVSLQTARNVAALTKCPIVHSLMLTDDSSRIDIDELARFHVNVLFDKAREIPIADEANSNRFLLSCDIVEANVTCNLFYFVFVQVANREHAASQRDLWHLWKKECLIFEGVGRLQEMHIGVFFKMFKIRAERWTCVVA